MMNWEKMMTTKTKKTTSKNPLRLLTVTFRANGPSKNATFNHVHVEATAAVTPGDDPERTFEDVRTWVLDKLIESQEQRSNHERNVSLDRAIEKKREELERLQTLRDGR